MSDLTGLHVREVYGDLVVVESKAPPQDAVAVESSAPPRALVGMQGKYSLDGWEDADGQSRQFECEILKISPHIIKLSAPVTGVVGRWVVAYFEHLGKFEGPIVQILPGILMMKIIGTIEDRAKVASKLAWMTDAEKLEARRFPRIVPANPESTVSVSGGVAVPCEVIDYSSGGAAMYAEVCPAIGSVVKIGKLLSRVVRHFGGGFAVSFVTLQDPRSVEMSILVLPPTRGELP
jgi:hypothetical protein